MVLPGIVPGKVVEDLWVLDGAVGAELGESFATPHDSVAMRSPRTLRDGKACTTCVFARAQIAARRQDLYNVEVTK